MMMREVWQTGSTPSYRPRLVHRKCPLVILAGMHLHRQEDREYLRILIIKLFQLLTRSQSEHLECLIVNKLEQSVSSHRVPGRFVTYAGRCEEYAP